jgi:V/A-type H+-transporting ATPase subunit E
MSEGAEKIRRRILDDAQSRVKELLAEAQEKADAIIGAAEEEAAQKKGQVLEDAGKEATEQKRRILGMAQLEARKETLEAKQALIAEAFQQALRKMADLEEEVYFDYLRQMLLVSIKTGTETIILSPRDRERIPAKFWKSLERELKASGRGGKITLGPASPEMEGGFILQAEGLEINNSFNALLSMHREELEPEVAAILFNEG